LQYLAKDYETLLNTLGISNCCISPLCTVYYYYYYYLLTAIVLTPGGIPACSIVLQSTTLPRAPRQNGGEDDDKNRKKEKNILEAISVAALSEDQGNKVLMSVTFWTSFGAH
jgi:hypothetical protein